MIAAIQSDRRQPGGEAAHGPYDTVAADARRDPGRSADLRLDRARASPPPATSPRAPPCSRRFPPRSIRASSRRCARAASSSSTATRRARGSSWRPGRHVVVVTPTASGKTLCYNLPVLQALVAAAGCARALPVPDEGARAGPARRARAARQAAARDADVHLRRRHAAGRAAGGAGARQPRADEPRHAALGHPAAPHEVGRACSRTSATSSSTSCTRIAASSARHLANVLRRLRRICAPLRLDAAVHHGLGDHRQSRRARRAASPASRWRRWPRAAPRRGEKIFVCYNPPVVNPELGIRAPYLGEAAQARASGSCASEIATIVFAQSRLSTEVLLTAIKSGVADRATGDAGIVRGYRGGYLPNRRRAVEQGLRDGRGARRRVDQRARARRRHRPPRRGACSPATRARSPRSGSRRAAPAAAPAPSAAILVATSAPLDQFMVDAPRLSLRHAARARAHQPRQPVHPREPPQVRAPSSCRSEADERFGDVDVRRELAALEDEGVLHRAGARYHWASETYPADHVSLRTVTTDNFLVIDTTSRDEKQTKRRQIIAEVDWGSAFATIYPEGDLPRGERAVTRCRSCASARTRRRSPTSSA